MPKIKCPKCGKETWWGVWSYKGVKLCGWCGNGLEVAVEDGKLENVKSAK
ncbi:MAG: hypothetical protein DDT32_02004 [Syntrophomonadaceae bacterium]|nr:hypothetical protein [Bacillota bacterium]